MIELSDAIAQLKTELEAANTVSGSRLQIVLGLSVSLDPNGKICWQIATGPTPHSVTIEWQREPLLTSSTPIPIPTAPSIWGETVKESSSDAVTAALETILGRPGFDSAARASVFIEILREMGLEKISLLLNSLELGKPSGDAAVDRVVQRVSRLLELGPIGMKRSVVQLQSLFYQQNTGSLLDLIEARWQYGTGHLLGEET
ncbi:MAG: hypothetical protein EXS25_08685 [Pedosphaera sp.]|nr:hypothetical protein [Pedosphaera sp.]